MNKAKKGQVEEQRAKVRQKNREPETAKMPQTPKPDSPIVALQNQIGNGAVQRLLAQRSGQGPTELDDDTASRINSARGGGQALDGGMQEQMGSAMGHDFSNVRVHTSGESDQLNQDLGAKAFTTGQDVFFRDGAYNPNSGSGQELIAHELTHVVQQSSGAVSSGGKMAVNDPGDRFEAEADSVAKAVTTSDVAPPVQRQAVDEEIQTKLAVQREEMPEEEEVQDIQAKLDVQRQEVPEEEEGVAQRQETSEEEELTSS